MAKRASLSHQVIARLNSLAAFGVSRHDMKKAQREALRAAGQPVRWAHSTGRIHSYATYEAYKQHSMAFVKWCRDQYGIRDLAQIDARADELASAWLEAQKAAGYSPYTLQTQRAALRMFYRGSGASEAEVRALAERVEIPIRHREEITRSRGPVAMDKDFCAQNWTQLIEALRGAGLRRHEVAALRAGDVIVCEDGRVSIRVARGKGGKSRTVQVIPGREQPWIDAIRGKSGDQRVFERIPVRLDVHSIRREAAQDLYRHLSGRDLPPAEGRLRPSDYDKNAAKAVSEWLGHERLDVVLRNYLR
jgi:site-specific recombinase XerC